MNLIKLNLLMLLAMATSALARQPEPLRLSYTSSPPAHPIAHVILVHGFLETGYAYRNLRQHLEAQQIACHVIQLTPSNARNGLEPLAAQLKQQIDTACGPKQRISIVGFSMGGIVSRYYLQNLGGAARCDQLITLASPHQGTYAAWIYPGKGTQQMRPGSDFLKQLQQTEDRLKDMPLASYRTPLDLVILPASHSIWNRAENRTFPTVLMHPLMLQNHKVLMQVEKHLLAHISQSPA